MSSSYKMCNVTDVVRETYKFDTQQLQETSTRKHSNGQRLHEKVNYFIPN